jgi:hypothetical protein
MLISSKKGGFSRRRRGLLVVVVLILAALGWMSWIKAAGLSGIESKDMDWNGDGTVTQEEILQSYYAVSVRKTKDGPRECSTFYWRKDDKEIRVDCRTSFETKPVDKPEEGQSKAK